MTETMTAFRYVPPSWSTGHVSHADAAFLTDLIQEVAPDDLVEVGVASGCSSAVLLHAMASVHGTPDPSNPWLYSFDVCDTCYFDPSRRVGEAVDELAPGLTSAWRLTIDQALAVPQVLGGREVSFAFIDACHAHPWPTFDLLALLPVLRAGAWVALHDIRLADLYPEYAHVAQGAEHLFDRWPWTKRTEQSAGNIGAIRLDAPRDEIVACCLDVLEKAWETCPPRAVRAALGLPERFLVDDADEQMVAIALRAACGAAKRPVIVWGAGQAGRERLAAIRGLGFQVDGFVDSDVRKQGTQIEGFDVREPGSLYASVSPRPYVVACGLYSDEISRELKTQGFVEGDDFIAVGIPR